MATDVRFEGVASSTYSTVAARSGPFLWARHRDARVWFSREEVCVGGANAGIQRDI